MLSLSADRSGPMRVKKFWIVDTYGYNRSNCSRLAARILYIDKRYGARPCRQTIEVGKKRVTEYWIDQEAVSHGR